MQHPSYLGRAFLRALLCRYPHRLSLGALTGLIIHILASALAPVVLTKTGVDLNPFSAAEYIFFGMFIFVFPTIFTPYRLDDDTEQNLLALRRIAEEGNLTLAQRRILYIELARRTLREHHPPSREDVAGQQV